MAGLLIYLVGALVQHEQFWITTTLGVVSDATARAQDGAGGLTRRIAPDDILTFGKFLLLTAVVLPLLPDQGADAVSHQPVQDLAHRLRRQRHLLRQLRAAARGPAKRRRRARRGPGRAAIRRPRRRWPWRARPRAPTLRLFSGATLIASGVMYVRIALLLLIFNHALFEAAGAAVRPAGRGRDRRRLAGSRSGTGGADAPAPWRSATRSNSAPRCCSPRSSSACSWRPSAAEHLGRGGLFGWPR